MAKEVQRIVADAAHTGKQSILTSFEKDTSFYFVKTEHNCGTSGEQATNLRIVWHLSWKKEIPFRTGQGNTLL